MNSKPNVKTGFDGPRLQRHHADDLGMKIQTNIKAGFNRGLDANANPDPPG